MTISIELKNIADQVVVITGASSGIGLATAREAAQRGAKVVLAARNGDALAKVEEEIRNKGGTATHAIADVADRAAVERIATVAIETYGRIDTWVNNAGLGTFGKLEQISEEDHRRLFETNFWGIFHGSMVALQHIKRHGGALINLGSEVSDIAVPMQGMYSASKHAIKGFTDALRMELEAEGAPVSVTLIKPAAINTPFPQHAKNYMSEEPKLPAPVYPPEEVANAILHAATHPVRDIYVGGASKTMSAMNKFVPVTMDWFAAKTMPKQQAREGERPRNPAGSLHEAGHDGHAHGDHPGYVMKTSLYTRASMHPMLTTAAIATAGLLVGALWSSKDGH